MMKHHETGREAGNVFLFILMGIALFAALMFTLSRGMNEGTGNITRKQAKLAATEIINYAQQVERGVARLQRKNISENDISFENDYVGTYTNPDCATDSCKVFKIDGGNVSYQGAVAEGLDSTWSANGDYGFYYFNGGIPIEDVGTTAPELLLQLNFLSKTLCMALNDQLGVDNPSDAPPTEDHSAASDIRFVGTFGSPLADILGDDVADLSGRSAFCRHQDVSGTANYQFNYVLIAR